jgi:hypothetical protein
MRTTIVTKLKVLKFGTSKSKGVADGDIHAENELLEQVFKFSWVVLLVTYLPVSNSSTRARELKSRKVTKRTPAIVV